MITYFECLSCHWVLIKTFIYKKIAQNVVIILYGTKELIFKIHLNSGSPNSPYVTSFEEEFMI